MWGGSWWGLGGAGIRRSPCEDIGQFWRRLHREGHTCMAFFDPSPVAAHRTQKHRVAGHFARLSSGETANRVLTCRDLSWWRNQQTWWKMHDDHRSGIHPQRFKCWRWEADFERAFDVSWKTLAQGRAEWKAATERFTSLSP